MSMSMEQIMEFARQQWGDGLELANFVETMLAIGADQPSTIGYLRSKAEGEAGIRETVPQAVIVRPSIVFGPEDDFFNRFAALARIAPVLPTPAGMPE